MLVLRVLRFYTLTPAFASQAMNVYNPEHLQNANPENLSNPEHP